jgi:hypothetical protein
MSFTPAQLTTLKAAILAAAALSLPAHADLTPDQLATMCTAVKANATANAARIVGDSTSVLTWLNAPRTPTVLAWRASVTSQEIDEASDYTAFDTVAAGKRDAWSIFLTYGPRNFGRNKNRAVITDVWGAATASSVAEAVLQAGTAPATNTQFALGGSSKTTGTVIATDFTVDEPATQADAIWLSNPANCN